MDKQDRHQSRSHCACRQARPSRSIAAIARAGQSIRLQVATTTLPPGPITLLFAEETATGRVPVRALLTVPGGRSLDGGYDVVVPRELCAGRTRASGNFEIQYLMSEINQAEGSGPSLGALTVAC
jgi:hypothetical protein